MKTLLLLLVVFLSTSVFGSAIISCGPGQIRVWTQAMGYSCIRQFQPAPTDCIYCQMNQPYNPSFNNWFVGFPPAIYQPNVMPWWAYQGNMYYPNLHYPGAWNPGGFYPGINPNYYPGQGQVHALKPNIYVESIHNEKKFSFSFLAKDPSFLATTPALDDSFTWKGKIVNKDRFEIDEIQYDYLFYDIRLPKEKMQFEHGVCTSRDDAINWMLNDLKEMKYPAIALQDFEEHWRVKIPNYPYYCIYPQYNQQLNEALPVFIILDQVRFTRSLYVMVPHRKEPNADQAQEIPFPTLDPAQIRPSSLIKYENMFKEWGVAFLGE